MTGDFDRAHAAIRDFTSGNLQKKSPLEAVLSLPVHGVYGGQSRRRRLCLRASRRVPATGQVIYNGTTGPGIQHAHRHQQLRYFAVNQSGGGPAVITYATTTAPFYAVVSNTNSTHRAQRIPCGVPDWGRQQATPTSPLAIWERPSRLGSEAMRQRVTYRGRSGSPASIRSISPCRQGTAPGCAISLVVQTNSLVSNNTTIPVAASGGTCSDAGTTQLVNPSTLPALLAGKTSVKLGLFDYRQQIPNQLGPDPIKCSAAGYVVQCCSGGFSSAAKPHSHGIRLAGSCVLRIDMARRAMTCPSRSR